MIVSVSCEVTTSVKWHICVRFPSIVSPVLYNTVKQCNLVDRKLCSGAQPITEDGQALLWSVFACVCRKLHNKELHNSNSTLI
jgi:hypothetical protein